MGYEIQYGGMRGGKTDYINTRARLKKPEPFMKVGEIGELNGEYYRLDGINNLNGHAYFTPIRIMKLKGTIDGYVELDE